MAAKNVNKNVESVIEDIRNFDKQINSNWDPTIEIKKYLSVTGTSYFTLKINYSVDHDGDFTIKIK